MKNVFVSALMVIIFLSLLASPVATAQETIDPAKVDASLIGITDKWAVWKTRELIKETERNVAQSFIHRVYRQNLSEADASLVHTRRDTDSGFTATVTEDGIVAIVSRGQMTWCLADGTSKVDPADHLSRPELYPDGAIVHDATGHEFRSVDFIPFKNQSLDFDSKVELIPAGVRRFRSPVVRDGGRLAWLRFEPRKEGDREKMGLATLHVYSIEDSKHTTQQLKSPLVYNTEATALGENLFIAGWQIFDVESGERLNPVNRSKERRGLSKIFAIRNNIGYYLWPRKGNLHTRNLHAVDLLNPKLPSIELLELPVPFNVTQTKAGITSWDGKGWQTTKWLKQWPGSDVQDKPLIK